MAVIYLRSTDGSDTDDGSTWALAKATLAAALTAAGAGGTVYVSQVHAETQVSAMTLTSPGTEAAPCKVLCVNDSAQPPTALATTATVTTTGNSAITITGSAYYYGIAFSAGTSGNSNTINVLNSAAVGWCRFEACQLAIAGGTAANIILGVTTSSNLSQLIEFYNTTVSFNAVGEGITCRCPLIWQATPTAIAGTPPTTLFTFVNARGLILIDGVDLSAAGSGKNLFTASTATPVNVRLQNCKLGASVNIVTGAIPGQGGLVVEVVRSASGATNYDYYKQTYQGTITQESTIVRTGGASDGTTPISRKMVSTADAKYISPLVLGDLATWNETTGSSVTATAEVVTDGVTLTDAEAWLEAEYLASALTPVSSFIDDAAANVLATPANQTTSTAAWTTTGLASPVKQKLSVTFTPNMKGPIRFRVMLAKASTTVYVCPKVDLT